MKQDERLAGLPLPPAVSRRGGRSRRESHETSLVPPFKGAHTFHPIIVQTRHAVAEQRVIDVPQLEEIADVGFETPEPLSAEDVTREGWITTAEIESLLTESDATLPGGELEIQDLLAAAGLEIPSVEAPPVDEFTLSPEFEEATNLNGLGDSDHVAEIAPVDVTILELGAFIAPPVVDEPAPLADQAAAAALAALAAEYDALEFDATIAEFDAPEFAAPTAEHQTAEFAAPIAEHETAEVEAPTAEHEAPEFDAPTAERDAPEFEAPTAEGEAPEPDAPTVKEVSPPVAAEAIEIPEATILEAVRSSGVPHHDLADKLQQLAQRLREQKPEELLPRLAQGDRFEVLIAGLLAGFLAARNE